MSKQGDEERVLAQLAEVVGCCEPLAREPLSAQQSIELSRVFKAMGDPVRLRLLSLIASHLGGEACVCDLTDVFDLSGPTISHHLKVLREAGLVTGERRVLSHRLAGQEAAHRPYGGVVPEIAARAHVVNHLRQRLGRAFGRRVIVLCVDVVGARRDFWADFDGKEALGNVEKRILNGGRAELND